MNGPTFTYMLALADKLRAAKHGTLDAIKREACDYTGVSLAELHRRLKEVGYDPARKRRKDAGTSKISTEQLEDVCNMARLAVRANGKRTLPIGDAVAILKANGRLPDISEGRVCELLRANGMHPDQVEVPKAHVQMAYEHPNYCWQLDASVCVLYYLSNGRGLGVMEQAAFNKNKPDNFDRIKNDRLIRWLITDPCSGALRVGYRLGSERAEDLIDFFIWAIQKHEGDPLHGVPFHLMMDPGAANTSQLAANLFKALKVKTVTNLPGQPRAKGSVENGQNIVETKFEGRLRFMRVETLEQLNAAAFEWARAFNSTAIHSRHKQTRYGVWMRITPEQLRIAPPVELCRDLVMTTPEPRTVTGEMTISYGRRGMKSATFDVRQVPGVYPGVKLQVVVNPYRAPAVDVLSPTLNADGTEQWFTVEPMVFDAYGYREDAARMGQEVRVAADTPADTLRKALDRKAYGADTLDGVEQAKKDGVLPMAAQQLDVMADVKQAFVPEYLPRRGEALQVEGRSVAAAPLNHVEAAKRLREALADAYSPAVVAWVRQRYPEGVPEDAIDAIVTQFGGKQAAADEPGTEMPRGLRLVQGGGA